MGDRILGLNAGADDYLPKPFDIDQVVDLVRRAAQGTEGAQATPALEGVPELLGRAKVQPVCQQRCHQLWQPSLQLFWGWWHLPI